MQRRNLLKTVALGFGGLVSMPAWANNWDKNKIAFSVNFSSEIDTLLAEIVETIIPETTTPGAKSLGVHQLIQKIVIDCQGKTAENKLIEGLKSFNELSQKMTGADFVKLTADQKLSFFKSIEKVENTEMKAFYAQLKRMTIDGYMKSEYVMTNLLNYEYAPARWHGCVPVKVQ